MKIQLHVQTSSVKEPPGAVPKGPRSDSTIARDIATLVTNTARGALSRSRLPEHCLAAC